jgi:hypothetical protein
LDEEGGLAVNLGERKTKLGPWAGAQERRGYTKKHIPLVWENMLGTVFARGPNWGEVKYFDYDYDMAHAYAETLTRYTDLRVCKAKATYADSPRRGQWALYGVPK